MKIYIIASLIFGLLSGGIHAFSNDTNDTTITVTDEPITLPVETTTHPVQPTTQPVETTSTLQPPSTTPLPTPPPRTEPKAGSWKVKSENRTCIRLDAAIQFEIIYENKNEVFQKTYLNVPSNASHSASSCELNILTLEFDGNNFSLKFVLDDGKVFAKQAILNYTVSEDLFPGAKDLGDLCFEIVDNLTLFKVPEGKSYLCKDEASKIAFTPNITGILTKIQVEAFKNSTSGGFSTAVECSSDKIGDIVPIAVGCALAALVIIVLIAYLVGRQRTRQRGYQSV